MVCVAGERTLAGCCSELALAARKFFRKSSEDEAGSTIVPAFWRRFYVVHDNVYNLLPKDFAA
jgi:hypothetical protein